MTTYNYDIDLAVDAAGIPQASVAFDLYDTPGGTIQAITDQGGTLLSHVVSNAFGVTPRFKASVSRGYLSAGILFIPILSLEAQDGAASTAVAASALALASTAIQTSGVDAAIAAVVAGPGPTATALTAAFGNNSMLTAVESVRKGGVIGVGNLPVIAIRTDDGQNKFKSILWPLLTARALVCSHALVAQFQTVAWGNQTTWADVKAWQASGVEIWHHGYNHSEDLSLTWEQWRTRELVDSADTTRAQGIRLVGWTPAGITQTTSELVYGTTLATPENYDSQVGRLAQSQFPISEGYIGGAKRRLPNAMHHGIMGVGVSTDNSLTATAALVNAAIDDAVARGLSTTLFFHPDHINNPAWPTITTASVTAILDHVVALRDAGTIAHMTPSAMHFASNDSTRSLDLYRKGDFVDVVAGDPLWYFGWGTKTVTATGGPNGSDGFVTIPTTESATGLFQLTDNVGDYSQDVFVASIWARSIGSVMVVQIEDPDNRPAFQKVATFTISGGTWKKYRVPFTLVSSLGRLQVAFARNSGAGNLDIGGITVKKY